MDEEDEADVGDLAGEIAAEKNGDEAKSAEGKLPEDRLESRPSESTDDERSEAGHSAVDCVGGGHEDKDEPELDVQERFA